MIDSKPEILEQIKEVDTKRKAGDFDNMLPLANVVIPQTVILRCPVIGQRWTQALVCATCTHFKGIVQTSYDDKNEIPWDLKFAISCGYPLDRKCSSIHLNGVKK